MRLNSDGTVRLDSSMDIRTLIIGGMKPQNKRMKKTLKQAKKKALKAWNDLIK